MIDTARRLAAGEGLAIRFEVGDAESLPYADASFDIVASALGAFLAPDHAAVARELARVCPPGGRLGVVAWRRDAEAERMHAPFWGPPEPGAGDRRAWGREEYVAALLGPAFAARSSPTTSVTGQTAASASRAATWSPSAAAGEAHVDFAGPVDALSGVKRARSVETRLYRRAAWPASA
jgi:SAM-dependent methyltransferase